jgi:hypothetical protein
LKFSEFTTTISGAVVVADPEAVDALGDGPALLQSDEEYDVPARPHKCAQLFLAALHGSLLHDASFTHL